MTDPDLNRADWMNEAYQSTAGIHDDIETMAEAASLVRSLIAIGNALTRSEMETAIGKLRAMAGNDGSTQEALTAALEMVEFYHKAMLAAQEKGHPYGVAQAFREDVATPLEDLEHHGLEGMLDDQAY